MKHNQREEEFLKAADVLMTEIGAALAAPHERVPAYVFPTWHGVLKIHPCAGKLAPKIFCRFLKPHWVQEIPGDFNRSNGRWNHYLWPDWVADFTPGLSTFAQRLKDIALSRDPNSSTDKPFRRADGSVVRFCKTPAGDGVEITTTSGQLWHKARTVFARAASPGCVSRRLGNGDSASRTSKLFDLPATFSVTLLAAILVVLSWLGWSSFANSRALAGFAGHRHEHAQHVGQPPSQPPLRAAVVGQLVGPCDDISDEAVQYSILDFIVGACCRE